MFYRVSQSPKFLSPEAQALLNEVFAPELQAAELNLQLRKQGYPPETIVEVVNQVSLRQKALPRLGELANRLLFTKPGLEQATRIEVARYHAKRLGTSSSVTDLGCGIGIDSIAFAEASLAVVAVEAEDETAKFARHNLSGFSGASVQVGLAEQFEIQTESVYLDPARRDLSASGSSRKMLRPEDFSPSIDFAFELLSKFPGGVKLSPAFPHELIDPRFEAAWVSNKGDLVELSQWSSDPTRAGQRFAVMVGEDEASEFSGSEFEAEVVSLSETVYEPDSSLIRSHLIGAFAAEHGLGVLSSGIAYLTGAAVDSPWLRAYELVEEIPLNEKVVSSYLAKHGIGVLEIKKRGVEIEPEKFRKSLKLKGLGAATLIATKVGGARKALICRPIR